MTHKLKLSRWGFDWFDSSTQIYVCQDGVAQYFGLPEGATTIYICTSKLRPRPYANAYRCKLVPGIFAYFTLDLQFADVPGQPDIGLGMRFFTYLLQYFGLEPFYLWVEYE